MKDATLHLNSSDTFPSARNPLLSVFFTKTEASFGMNGLNKGIIFFNFRSSFINLKLLLSIEKKTFYVNFLLVV